MVQEQQMDLSVAIHCADVAGYTAALMCLWILLHVSPRSNVVARAGFVNIGC